MNTVKGHPSASPAGTITTQVASYGSIAGNLADKLASQFVGTDHTALKKDQVIDAVERFMESYADLKNNEAFAARLIAALAKKQFPHRAVIGGRYRQGPTDKAMVEVRRMVVEWLADSAKQTVGCRSVAKAEPPVRVGCAPMIKPLALPAFWTSLAARPLASMEQRQNEAISQILTHYGLMEMAVAADGNGFYRAAVATLRTGCQDQQALRTAMDAAASALLEQPQPALELTQKQIQARALVKRLGLDWQQLKQAVDNHWIKDSALSSTSTDHWAETGYCGLLARLAGQRVILVGNNGKTLGVQVFMPDGPTAQWGHWGLYAGYQPAVEGKINRDDIVLIHRGGDSWASGRLV